MFKNKRQKILKVYLVTSLIFFGLILPFILQLIKYKIPFKKSEAALDTVEGNLSVYIADNFEANTSRKIYKLTTSDGKVTDVNYNGSKKLISGSHVKISGSQQSETSYLVDETTNPDSLSVVSEPDATILATGSKKVAVILMNFDTSNYQILSSPTQTQASTYFNSTIKNFYSENSYGKLNLTFDVFGWFKNGIPNCLTPDLILYMGVVAADENNIDLAPYSNLILVVPPQGCKDGARGLATIGNVTVLTKYGLRTLGISWVDGTLWQQNIFGHPVTHEFGHNLGLEHSNGYDCDLYSIASSCQSREYSDYWEPMGKYYYVMEHYNAFRKYSVGWLSSNSILFLDPNVLPIHNQFTIAPLETNDGTLPRAVAVKRDSSTYYYIENRRPIGFDAQLPSYITNGALIYIVPKLLSNGNSHFLDLTPSSISDKDEDFSDGALAVGETFKDIDKKIDIKLLSKDSNGNMAISINSAVETTDVTLVNPPDNFIFHRNDPAIQFVWNTITTNPPINYQLEWNPSTSPGAYRSVYPMWFKCGNVCTDAFCSLCFAPVTSDSYTITWDGISQIYWRVNAKDNNGTIHKSTWRKIFLPSTTSTPTPSPKITPSPVPIATPTPSSALIPPTQLTPFDRDLDVKTLPVFDWTDIVNSSSYQIQVSKDTTFASASLVINASPTNSTYTSTITLTKGATYYWRLRTKYPSGNSTWSPVWSFRVSNPPSVPVLASPANSSLLQTDKPNFKWNASTRTPTKYQIQICEDLNLCTIDYGSTVPSTQTSFTPSVNLPRVKIYSWKVRAFNAYGEWSGWSSIWKVKVAPTVPLLSAPPNGSVTILRPTFAWNLVSGATGYRIQISLNSDMSSPVIDNNSITTNSFTPGANLGSKKTYYWRVLAKSPVGSSSWSTKWSFKTP